MTTEEIAPGFRGPTGASVCGRLRPEVVEDLHLDARGVQSIQPDPEVVALGEDRALRIWRDVRETQEGLGSFSAKDDATHQGLVDFMRQFDAALDQVLAKTPPSLPSTRLREQS